MKILKAYTKQTQIAAEQKGNIFQWHSLAQHENQSAKCVLRPSDLPTREFQPSCDISLTSPKQF